MKIYYALMNYILYAGLFFSVTQSFASPTTTFNTIQANSPNLISEIENQLKQNDEFEYFGVVYNGVTYSTIKSLNSALKSNIIFKTPNSLALTATIIQPTKNDIFDSNGDIGFILSESYDNSVVISWHYKDDNGVDIKLTEEQTHYTFGNLIDNGIYPYIKVSGSIALTTKNVDSKSHIYPDSHIVISKMLYRNFYIYFADEAVSYASPNMSYSTTIYSYGDPLKFSTVYQNGFVPQDNYLNNFPSTSANKLYFYLVTTGIDNTLDSTKWTVRASNQHDGSLGKISATVAKSEAPSTIGFKAYDSKNMVLVTLSGPDSSSKNEFPATAPTAKLPVDIELIATTKQGITLSYKFRITKWFINRGNVMTSSSRQAEWCKGLGNYQQATARDLSNARLDSLESTAKNNYPNYKRAVHEGFFSEWGATSYFSGANFYSSTPSWVKTVSPKTGYNVDINMNDGALYEYSRNISQYYGLCVSK